MLFEAEIQQELRGSGFDLECVEENIWIKEIGDESVTVSGEGSKLRAIWQDFDGNFEDYVGSLEEVMEWADKKLGKGK